MWMRLLARNTKMAAAKTGINTCANDTMVPPRAVRDGAALYFPSRNARPTCEEREKVRHWPSSLIVAFLVTLGAASSTARADVTRLEIETKRPYGTFRGGEFVYWEGKVRG